MGEQQLESLRKWLDTFDLVVPHGSSKDISDGVALAEALAQIAPEWFTSAWRSKIKSDVGTSWRLRVSNLKKIVEAVMEYYSECLNQPLSGYVKPDASKIGELCDSDELRRLLQLVLGCAVNCTDKQKYITRIMGMEESVQQAIMQSIQELEGSMHGAKLSLGASLNFESLDVGDGGQQRLLAELQMAVDLKDQLGQRCHELDQQLSLLQEERAALIVENKKLQERLEELDNPDNSASSLKFSGLRKQIENLKDEIFKIEGSRDDYRLKVELLEKEVFELQSKQEELQKVAEESNQLKDEIDALKETADKAIKYEQTIESYKKKMEDLSDLRRQVKILEEKNLEYMQSKIEYEEEIKRASMVRNHLDGCKQQLAACQYKFDEQTNKCDKLEFETKKLEAKLSSVQREKERLIIERDTLKETNEELKCTQLQIAENSSTPTMVHALSNAELIPPEIKEKLLLLEHENKMLKLEQSGNDEKLPTVQALLDDSEERLNALRGQIRKANQRIMELENRIEELTEQQASGEIKVDGAVLQTQILHLQNEIKQLQGERERSTLQIDEKEGAMQMLKEKVRILQDSLTRKEEETAALEERYRKYIEKAKSVIRGLDPKLSNSPGEVMLLRNQLVEKRKNIEDLERSMRETKVLRDMEEKLMVSAFYNLGLACQRESVDQRLAALGTSQGNSFLSRQRQPSARRTLHPTYNSK
ncbi:protein Hook homolog 3 [Fopius arisanus]|uniref:Protein hook n=1 Tax=Fopius arisanus TaxID=64838 RepID=A0A0C9RMG0_9HYME|nr:PREDICTED: protein Hook homolog 3 [Fopius arisanus]XP_011310306.1 PREDICTED: protein Hook homolog 3 [Fopius arisanus]XP_011310307.1 PREDICTED: protein Hook homolog 3 [Fopius arisanus]XP_011310308.1 PREDICTED: protein Hook homolog 3 [Fopius arisanus]